MNDSFPSVQWLTKSIQIHEFVKGAKNIQFSGGMLYGIAAIDAIRKNYHISVNLGYIKHESSLKYFFKKHKNFDADICISDPYILALDKLDYNKFNIAMIHHIDEGIAGHSLLSRVFFKKLYKNLRKVDLVIVVSRFWKSFLENKGIKNIRVIYNAYDPAKYVFDEEEVNVFEERLGLDSNRPTIYIGKNSSGKGIDDVLRFIDCSRYNLIASGKNAPRCDKYRCFYLSDNEFPMLLKISDIVLSMSTMPEGWNRIAHEAMLVKTPVIGSGKGGMGELLKNGKQKVITNLSALEETIQEVLANKQELGDLGFEYVKNLNISMLLSL